MDAARNGLGALTLFVEELDTVTAFYRDVLGLDLVYQDDQSSVVGLGGTLLNLLAIDAAPGLVEPAPAAPVGPTAQMVLSLFVDDVDAVCADLRQRGVALLNGPVDRPWGKRTAAFTDPAGTVWEIAQDLPAGPGQETSSTS
jgi:catechol 2,3-dioxygenase-like lactoylglutathione lyase family enzyme